VHNLPEYWFCLVIFVDDNLTPLSELQNQITVGNMSHWIFSVAQRDLDTDDEDNDNVEDGSRK
jgi:hypothetical protein